MNKIWTFGCSFSSGHLDVPREKSYSNLIANELNYEIKNLAEAGNSNDKILFDLMNNLENINNDDIIFFQFSSFNRIGHFIDDNTYFSTAGMPELGVKHKMKEYIFSDIPEYDLEILLDYILSWQDKRRKFDLDNSLNLLSYLQQTKNVKYFILYLTNEYYKITDNTLVLPIENNVNNVSINDFVVANKLTLSDDFPEKYTYFDSHPGISGHEELKKIILNKL